MNCCNPLYVDDEEINMELEDIWELQRQKSKVVKGGMNPFSRNKNRRSFSMTRNWRSGTGLGSGSMMGRKRSMSAGRNSFNANKLERPALSRGRSKSPWRSGRNRQVSINKMVERIETKPFQSLERGRSRGRSLRRTPSRAESRSSNRHTGRHIERSLSIVRVRSKSLERKRKDKQDNQMKQQARLQHRRNMIQQQRRRNYTESSDDESDGGSTRRSSGILSFFQRREGRNDEWSSSDESSIWNWLTNKK